MTFKLMNTEISTVSRFLN